MIPNRCITGLLVLSVLTLLSLGGCNGTPTTIVVAVSFRNQAPRRFPPTKVPAHSGICTDDVFYVRLSDSGGWAADIDSVPKSASILASYEYDPDNINPQNPTSPDGVYLGSVTFILTDAELASATMPLRLEAYLYDGPTGVAANPSTDADLYSFYTAGTEGDQGWNTTMTITGRTIKNTSLQLTVPFE